LGITAHEPLDISVSQAYDLLLQLDPLYMQRIERNDKYRVEKAYNIYKQTALTPSEYFLKYPKKPFVKELPIFEITWEVEELRKRIALRTQQMLQQGLIDEVIF